MVFGMMAVSACSDNVKNFALPRKPWEALMQKSK